MSIASFAFPRNAFSDTAYGRDWSPLAVSMLPTVELPSQNWDVYGFRIDIFAGRHHDVSGIDVGSLANFATGDFVGMQLSGVVSKTDNTLTGCQISPISLAGTLEGVQVGVFNKAEGLWGLQVGVVNYAYQANGVQIGIVNIIENSELPILPVVNIGF